MRKRVKSKIKDWQSRPEHERMRIAARITWISGISLVGVWLLLLLPFHFYINRGEAPAPTPQVQGVVTETSPTSTPTPTDNPYFE